MAEFTDVSPPITDPPERSGLVGRTRFGLSFEPSPELHDTITSFLRPEVLRRKIGHRIIRLNVTQRPIDIVRGTETHNRELLASIDNYSQSIASYEHERQFRLMADGFEYNQVRNSRGAFTALTFQVYLSREMRNDIIKPPFFGAENSDLLSARVVFPNDQVVPFADQQAETLETAMQADHPSAVNGLTSFAFSLTGLRVSKRSIGIPPILRIVEDTE